MSAVVDALEDAWDAVVDLAEQAWSVIEYFYVDIVWKYFFVEPLRLTMSLFGITDEDVITTEVIDTRLMPDDNFTSFMTEVALEHQKTDKGIIDIFLVKAAQIRGSFNGYFDYGKNTFIDGLPTTNLRSEVIDKVAIKNILDSELASNTTIVSANLRTPYKDEYVAYKLKTIYNSYTAWNNILQKDVDGLFYTVTLSEYNFTTNNYDITIHVEANKHIVELTDTVITVVNKDATTDTVTQTVTVHRTEEFVLTPLNGDAIIPDPSASSDVQTVTVYDVPIGSVVPSAVYGVETMNTSISSEYLPEILSLVSFPLIRYFVVKYYINMGEEEYWIYDPTTNLYPSINAASSYITELDMLPVVKLRGDATSITSDKTSVRYKESAAILKYIGIDVDNMISSIEENPDIANIEDAFIHFAIDPNDQDNTVQKVVYQMFDYLYYQTSLVQEDATYLMTFTEQEYNIAVSWKTQQRTIHSGVIGSVGSYKSAIVMETVNIDAGEYGTVTQEPTLYSRYQINSSSYIEYKITGLVSMTFIKRAGLTGLVAKDVTMTGFVLPISKYFVDSLSPNEQMVLFRKALRLAIYSAQITHLEWYETSEFAIVLQIVAIAIAIFSLGTASSLSAALWTLATMAAMYAVSYALSMMFDNPFLRAAVAIAMVAVGAYMGYFDPSVLDMVFMTANQLTGAVTEFYNDKYNALVEDFNVFTKAAEAKFEELNTALEAIKDYVTTDFVQGLATSSIPTAYIQGVDAMMYRAVSMQKDVYELSLHKPYENIYDYDKYYRIGVV